MVDARDRRAGHDRAIVIYAEFVRMLVFELDVLVSRFGVSKKYPFMCLCIFEDTYQ